MRIRGGDDACAGTPVGTPVGERGGPLGDCWADGVLTYNDFAALLPCLTGPAPVDPLLGHVLNHVLPACGSAFDRDRDHGIDRADAAQWQLDYSGG